MMFLFIIPAVLALVLANLWFLAVVPLAWGVHPSRKQHPGDAVLAHPLVHVGLAWLLVAAPTVWPGRHLPPSLLVSWIPAYGCLDILLIAAGFLWFAISFLRAWGHRPKRVSSRP